MSIVPEIRMDDVVRVENQLITMEENALWPNGTRYLWTDAVGLTVLLSVYEATRKPHHLDKAYRLVADVDRVLGRPRGYRIGEAPDRDGQYYHYLAMWIHALWRFSRIDPSFHDKAVGIVREIHPAFVVPGSGVVWKMRDDLSRPYAGTGLGALDPYHGLVVYRLLDEAALADEIRDLETLITKTRPGRLEQDLGLGMMLWLTHFFPDEAWAVQARAASLRTLGLMWVDPPGYFARTPLTPEVRYAFTNYGVALGLRAVGAWPERVDRLMRHFETYRSGDHYDIDPITHVMRAAATYPAGFLRPSRPA